MCWPAILITLWKTFSTSAVREKEKLAAGSWRAGAKRYAYRRCTHAQKDAQTNVYGYLLGTVDHLSHNL